MNVVAISGNLTKDVEIRSTATGVEIAMFTVAVNDSRKNQQTGEWESIPNYIGCVKFKPNKGVRELKKGKRVTVSGKLRYSSWEGNDGQTHSKIEVIANEVEWERVKETTSSHRPPDEIAPQKASQGSIYDQDIPF